MIWGFDVSSWQSQGSTLGNNHWELSDLSRFPLDQMRENGCRFGIAKYSMQSSKDLTAGDHSKLVRDADMQVGGYHWCDPIGNWIGQADLFRQQISAIGPSIQAFDVEQYWGDWKDYSKIILPAEKIVDNFLKVYDCILAAGLIAHPLIYTAHWFISQYVKTRYSELNVCPLWVAHYTCARNYVQTNFKTYKLTSWAQFQQLLDYLKTQQPQLPPGFSAWKLWQFDSKTILPGAPYAIDLNLFNGTEEEYNEWLNLDIPAEVPDNVVEAINDILVRMDELEFRVKDIEDTLVRVSETLARK